MFENVMALTTSFQASRSFSASKRLSSEILCSTASSVFTCDAPPRVHVTD